MDLLRQASVAIVGLIGGHSARLDSSVKAAKSVWTWCNKMMPTRYSPEDIAPLRVVQYFATAAAQQSDISLLQASFMETANESRVQLGLPHTFDECDGASDSLYYHQLVLIHLTGTLASVLSVEHLRKGTSDRATTSNPRDDLHRWFKNNVEAWFPEGHEMALFQQSYGRILLTLGEFKFAQHEIRKALDHAQPHMLHTIEACRQIQLAIDLEEQSRVSTEEQIKSKVNEEATKAIESRMKETDKRIKELTKLEQEIKDTRIQISNSQLRVVEVLGVFLAVAGIAVTSVGGIAVEGSIPVRIAIWFAGYGSLVSLFFLLRLIVGKSPSQDNGETPEGAPGDEST